MRFLFICLFMSFPILYGQEYYQKNDVEGYILKSELLNKILKENRYLDPQTEDIDCFELKLKEKVPYYYSNFYRQYYSKNIDGNTLLMVTLVDKKRIKKKEWLKDEVYIVLDGCESVRYIIYDIKKQQIIRDVNGGGCL